MRSGIPARAKPAGAVSKGVYTIPHGATSDTTRWRAPIKEWVQGFISDTEIRSQGLVAHNWNLYVPIAAGCFLYRNFDPAWEGPKWIKRGAERHYYVPCVASSDVLVVTEDCISAIVVSRQRDALALMCTSIHEQTLAYIQSKGYREARVWLDDDNTQVRAAQNKVRDRLSLVIPTVQVIRAGTDPKNCDPITQMMYLI